MTKQRGCGTPPPGAERVTLKAHMDPVSHAALGPGRQADRHHLWWPGTAVAGARRHRRFG